MSEQSIEKRGILLFQWSPLVNKFTLSRGVYQELKPMERHINTQFDIDGSSVISPRNFVDCWDSLSKNSKLMQKSSAVTKLWLWDQKLSSVQLYFQVPCCVCTVAIPGVEKEKNHKLDSAYFRNQYCIQYIGFTGLPLPDFRCCGNHPLTVDVTENYFVYKVQVEVVLTFLLFALRRIVLLTRRIMIPVMLEKKSYKINIIIALGKEIELRSGNNHGKGLFAVTFVAVALAAEEPKDAVEEQAAAVTNSEDNNGKDLQTAEGTLGAYGAYGGLGYGGHGANGRGTPNGRGSVWSLWRTRLRRTRS
uniref:Uncharacterized protein n=1 Tax=Daphnia galeata TaxID=27404 RepID=A0A8J2RNS7_9CRUS|nr:unnamed protein product [Daphnia galeata]